MKKPLTFEVIKNSIERKMKEYEASPDTKLMRYMDFAKFLSILENKEIYLSRADNFEVPLEGSLPKNYMDRMFPSIIPFKKEYLENTKSQLIDQVNSLKGRAYISCWNEAENESYALWQV